MANPSDPNLIRLSIIDSLFTAGRASSGQTGQAYIAHCKTWEDVPGSTTGERKPRYILLAVASTGKVFLHKSKRNTNGSFSIGKTWDLSELRALELVDALALKITLGPRAYVWLTEQPQDRITFLNKIVRCYRQYTNGVSPALKGFTVEQSSSSTPAYSIPPPAGAAPGPGPPPPTAWGSTASLQPIRPLNVVPAASRPSAQAGPASFPSRLDEPQTSTAPPPGRVPPLTAPAGQGLPPRRPQNPPPLASEPLRTRSTSGGSTPASQPAPPMNGVPPTAKSVRPQIQLAVPNGRTTPTSRGPLSADANSTRSRSPFGEGSNGPKSAGATAPPSFRSLEPKDAAPPGSRGISPLRPAPDAGSRGPSPMPAGPAPTAMAPSRSNQSTRSQQSASTKGKEWALDEEALDAKASKAAVPVEVPDAHDILNNVEEMLEGFEWRSGSAGRIGLGVGVGTTGRTLGLMGTTAGGLGLGGLSSGAEAIEARLLSELQALEAAEIHAIIANDDRTGTIVKHLDEALAELERMDLMLSLYKTQLNVVADDIEHIESQNRGLQVQTSNQRALLQEIEQLMQTIHIPREDLDALANQSLDSQQGIVRLEAAATTLYKALLSTRDGNVAAAAEREVEYRKATTNFSRRLYDFLVESFKTQAGLVSSDKSKTNAVLPSHEGLEKYLDRYCGLTLFIKEMDNNRYQQLCAAYFTTASDLHKQEVTHLLGYFRGKVRKATEDELEASFAGIHGSPTTRAGTIRKAAGSAVRSPLLDRKEKEAEKNMTGGEAFRRALDQIAPHIIAEQNFVTDFLHLYSLDNAITFADYASLEGYFKRSAMAFAVKNQQNTKDVTQIMDLIFGFLSAEIKQWIESMLSKDPMQIVGILAALDVTILEAEAARNDFLIKVLQSQYRRSSTVFERHVKEQLKAIEQTKLTVKKRKGVVPFIRIFPDFAQRIEAQLVDVDPEAEVRTVVNGVYEQTITAMFEALQTIGRSDEEPGASQEDRDKDRLNYHTLLIENMHHFVTVVSKMKIAGLKRALGRAKERYDENMNLYIRLILRRPCAKLIDFFQGIEQLLATTPASEISLHSQYTKSAAKRVISSMDRKDLKRAIEALSKRVEKHFIDITNPSADNAVVVGNVWKACEDEVLKSVGSWKALTDKCYGAEGVSLEISQEDVHSSFSRYRPGL